MPTLNITDFGAVYNDQSKAAIQANDNAFNLALKRLQPLGGTIVIDDLLAISQQIYFPTITFNGVPGFPMPLALKGNGSTSRLMYSGTGCAIVVDIPDVYPANCPYGDLRMKISDLALCGGGLKIRQGGKYLIVDNLTISGVNNPGNYALDIWGYDGGLLGPIYIHNCQASGFHIQDSHHTWIDLTSRENDMGGQIDNCVLSGRLYCESNRSYGYKANKLARSTLQQWLEGNASPFQAVRRDCWGNLFNGQDQWLSNQGYDDDPISAACGMYPYLNSDMTVSDFSSDAWYQNVSTNTGFTTGLHTDYNTPTEVELNGTRLTVHPVCFQDTKPNMWVEPTIDDKTQNMGGTWNAGDYLFFDVAITCLDDQTWKFLRSQNRGVFHVSCNNPAMGRDIWMTQRAQTFTFFGKTSSAGSGARLFLLPCSAPAPFDLNFNITASVNVLAGTTK